MAAKFSQKRRRKVRRRRRSIQIVQLCPALSTLPLRFNDNVISAGQLCPALFLAPSLSFFISSLVCSFCLFFIILILVSSLKSFPMEPRWARTVWSPTQYPGWGLVDEFTAFLYLCFFSFILCQVCLILAPSLLFPPTVYSSLLYFPIPNLPSPSFPPPPAVTDILGHTLPGILYSQND